MSRYIYRRGDIWYVCLHIPNQYRDKFGGKSTIRLSLHTTNRKHAQIVAYGVVFAMKKDFEDLKDQILELEKYRTSGVLDLNSPTPTLQPPVESEIFSGGVRISEVIDKFCAEKVQTGNWTAKTEDENRAIFRLFIFIVGDIKITDIGYATANKYKEILLKLPPNINKKYPGLSLSKVLEKKDAPMSPNTANKNLNRMSGLFDWMCRHGYADKNYFANIGVKKKKRDSEARDIFSPEDLRRLFPVKSGKHPYCQWLPYLGLYTGARLNELCQLYISDIYQKDNIWIIDINNNTPDKRLKNKASKRIVPIHSKLIEMGFIDFVRNPKRKRLFPELRNERDGYGQAASKWFNRYKLSVGIVVKDKKKDFHSFRHLVATTLKNSSCIEQEIASILGHTTGSMSMEHYGKAYNIEHLKNTIEKLVYDLDLLKCNN